MDQPEWIPYWVPAVKEMSRGRGKGDKGKAVKESALFMCFLP